MLRWIAWPDLNTLLDLSRSRITDCQPGYVLLQLELVQDNLKYFLEIMQNNKSVLLEWLIIALISAEIALGVFEIITRV